MKEVHLICNAHIDPIWQWDWQEGASAAVATFASAVKLLKKHDFIFCHNEVTVYKYVEEYAPELFEEIKELVKKGKWIIIGGWYLQPDCNMPCGESMVRQILFGKKYFTEKFGVFPEIAFNVDAFGHSRGLVQIIKKCGQSGNIICRPYPSETNLPHSRFIWVGPDGSEIKVMRAVEGYNTLLGKSLEIIKRRAAMQPEQHIAVLWGVGNHGGGPSDKDLRDIENYVDNVRNTALSADKTNEERYELIHSSPERFFKTLTPEGREERSLRIAMPGCYTSLGKLKREHVKLENELYLAEEICSAASLNGLTEYPLRQFDTINEDLMNAEFHDVLPGSSVKAGEENGLKLLLHGRLDAERLKTKAFFALCGNLPPAKKGEFPIAVFNSRPYDYSENVECEFMLADQNWDEENISSVSVYDEKGEAIPFQIVKEESNINLDWRKKIIFSAPLKAFSVNRFGVFVDYKKRPKSHIKQDFEFKNDYKYVRIGQNSGLIESYKIDGVEYIKDGAIPVMFEDNADPWAMSAFQQKRLGTDEKPFALSENKNGIFKGLKSVQVIENGEIYLGIEAFFELYSTKVRVLYKVYKNNPHIDVDVNVFLGDKDKFVKLKIPVCGYESETCEVIGQTMFGAETLFIDARENVSQRYIAVKNTNGKYLEVINNCVYGSHFENNALYVSLVRGVTYCTHPILDRELCPKDRFTKKADQGENDFSFRITVAKENELERNAKEFNFKPFAVNVFPIHTGAITRDLGGICISNPNITLEAVKKKEDGNGFVLRLLNGSRSPASATLTVMDQKTDLSFSRYEVKTVLYNENALTESPLLVI